MSDPDRDLMLTELLEQWHDGSLSESARDEFQRRLLAEPALRQEARVAVHMHQLLGDWFDAGSAKRTAAAVEMLLDCEHTNERQRLIRAVEIFGLEPFIRRVEATYEKARARSKNHPDRDEEARE